MNPIPNSYHSTWCVIVSFPSLFVVSIVSWLKHATMLPMRSEDGRLSLEAWQGWRGAWQRSLPCVTWMDAYGKSEVWCNSGCFATDIAGQHVGCQWV